MLTSIVWQMLKGGGGIIAFSFEQKNSNHLRICLNNCVSFLLIYSEFYLESCFAMTYCNVLSLNAKSSMSLTKCVRCQWSGTEKGRTTCTGVYILPIWGARALLIDRKTDDCRLYLYTAWQAVK